MLHSRVHLIFLPFLYFCLPICLPIIPHSPHPSSDLFQVERILKMQVLGDGRKMFLVKWQGYPLGRCTWEPFENILALTFADLLSLTTGHTSPHPLLGGDSVATGWKPTCRFFKTADPANVPTCRFFSRLPTLPICQFCQSANLQVFSRSPNPPVEVHWKKGRHRDQNIPEKICFLVTNPLIEFSEPPELHSKKSGMFQKSMPLVLKSLILSEI